MDVDEEQVALVDDQGRVVGSAPRRIVRARNLAHLATGVIVRNSLGLVYVHRRTPTKDVFAGMHDCCAGGVVGAGEAVETAARRELAEELGIAGVPLRRVWQEWYADEHTRYLASVYEVTWDGPVRHQPEEVEWGGWMTLEELAERLADPGWPFVPDTRALLDRWLAERLGDRVALTGGWDSATFLVEGQWIDRVPRRPAVEEALRCETRLLPWLAPQLPLPVPVPVVVAERPLRVRHRRVPGSGGGPYTAAMGTQVGRFLRALHHVPADAAVASGARSAAAAAAELAGNLARFRGEVVPALPPDRRAAGTVLLDDVSGAAQDTLVHADLGPAHLLVHEDRISGVIDWSDARIGDAALDLAWVLHGAPPVFAVAVASAYGLPEALGSRALRWHRLGPWHEVLYGIDTDQPAYVESGLAGILARL